MAAYRQTVKLTPAGVSSSQSSLAYLLALRGALAEALALNLEVRQDDPRQTFADMQLAWVYELLGYTAVAEALYERSFKLYPDNLFSNVAYPKSLFYRVDLARHAK